MTELQLAKQARDKAWIKYLRAGDGNHGLREILRAANEEVRRLNRLEKTDAQGPQ